MLMHYSDSLFRYEISSGPTNMKYVVFPLSRSTQSSFQDSHGGDVTHHPVWIINIQNSANTVYNCGLQLNTVVIEDIPCRLHCYLARLEQNLIDMSRCLGKYDAQRQK